MVKQSFIHQSSLNGLSSEIESSGTCCGCTIVAYVRYEVRVTNFGNLQLSNNG